MARTRMMRACRQQASKDKAKPRKNKPSRRKTPKRPVPVVILPPGFKAVVAGHSPKKISAPKRAQTRAATPPPAKKPKVDNKAPTSRTRAPSTAAKQTTDVLTRKVSKSAELTRKTSTPHEAKELKIAQSNALAQFYNQCVGDNSVEGTKKDKHGNAVGTSADLGRDGAYSDYTIAVGNFCPGQVTLDNPRKALAAKGFNMEVTSEISKFMQMLDWADQAWVVVDRNTDAPDFDKCVAKCVEYHKAGHGLWLWADNAPWLAHCSEILDSIFPGLTLVGNKPGKKVLNLGDTTEPGHFKRHVLTTGIEKLFEGITICYPKWKGKAEDFPLKVLARGSDGEPCVCFADNEIVGDDAGRIMVDCGVTKLFCNWDDAGTARYCVNGAVWLLGLEHRVAVGRELKARMALSDRPKTKGGSDGIVESSRFKRVVVKKKQSITQLVAAEGLKFNKGKGFYEITKKEDIQVYKEIILFNTESQVYVTGGGVRKALNIPEGQKVFKYTPGEFGQFKVFVQSTSVNRQLLAGTEFLYEVA